MNKEVIHTALIAIAAYAVVSFINKGNALPIVGAYLPASA